jgi:NAD(P)-dependent dehydrogenase (short-subunit alcohol dehydrogenase family)
MEEINIKNLFSVKGKVCLVTGGSGGIGLMIAKGLIKNGCKVYITSRKSEVCDKVEKELNELNTEGKCISLPADLSLEKECISKIIFNKGVSEFLNKNEKNGIDVLINNAGCNWGEKYENFPSLAFEKVFDLNVKSVFILTKLLTPLLKKKASTEHPSKVINIGSIDGIRVPFTETYSYSSSKAALHHLTEVLANRLSQDNITVNCIAPGIDFSKKGPFQSKMMKVTLEKFEKQIINNVPLKRIGNETDIIGMTIFLCSDAGNYVTGTIIPLDGGILIKSKM